MNQKLFNVELVLIVVLSVAILRNHIFVILKYFIPIATAIQHHAIT